MIKLNKRKLFTCRRAETVTNDMVKEALQLHRDRLLVGYLDNEKMYLSDHAILHGLEKDTSRIIAWC